MLVDNPGTYYAESLTPPPCAVPSTGVIEVILADCDLLIPNVITPGNDDTNNRFYIPNLSQFSGSTVRIYNRWGGVVFSHDDFGSTQGWLPGPEVSEGTYYYVLHIARTNEVISVITEGGSTPYHEGFGPIDLTGSFMLFRGP